MKKIAASVGLLALGASFTHAADDSFVSGDAGKFWKLSASLRGFYDDNINTATEGTAKVGSFGFSVSPGVTVNWQKDQNTLDLSYVYSLLYYARQAAGFAQYDSEHNFNAMFNHNFSERYSVRVADSFAVGQEPGLLGIGGISPSISRQPGNNYRNDGSINFDAQLTPLFGLELGYENQVFFYHQKLIGPFLGVASEAGSSDQMIHLIHLDTRWQVLPETVAVLGYQFGIDDFTGGEIIEFPDIMSNSRNTRSHYVYVGADQNFTPELQGSARVGVRLTDNYNYPTGANTDTEPYVKLGLTYAYAPECTLSGGFSYDRNSTDVIDVGSSTSGPVKGQESANIFASVRHRIVANFFGSLNAQFQDATFIGGDIDGKSERYLILGLNFQYLFTQYLSAEVGYDYDKVMSDINRDYERNRVYIGFTGSY